MKKVILLVVLIFIILGCNAYLYLWPIQVWYTSSMVPNVEAPVIRDVRNATYIIDHQTVSLVGGVSQLSDTASSVDAAVTRYFGNGASGDLNGDGRDDQAFLLTQEAGGSGTFFYIAAVLDSKKGLKSLETVFLGDRIAPQSTEIKDGLIIVNYADRNPGEPMSARPSLGVSRYFKVLGDNLLPVKAPQ